MTVRHDDCATRGANAIYDYATNGCVTFVLQKGVKSMLKCNFFCCVKFRIVAILRLSWEILAYVLIFVNYLIIFDNLVNYIYFFVIFTLFWGKLKSTEVLVV